MAIQPSNGHLPVQFFIQLPNGYPTVQGLIYLYNDYPAMQQPSTAATTAVDLSNGHLQQLTNRHLAVQQLSNNCPGVE